MIAHGSFNSNMENDEAGNEDTFWGLNSIIEEYHHNVRRNAIRSCNHLTSIAVGVKAHATGHDHNRQVRQQAWHTDVHQG